MAANRHIWRAEPLDNQRLAHLCGPLDENLRQIERACAVAINRRNERFTLMGEADACDRAALMLQKFYDEADQAIGIDRIQLGLIDTMPADMAESPVHTRLLTRKRELKGRTPQQTAYLEAIVQNDVCFGLGPAGTGKTYLAVACAVDAFEREQVDRIVLTRPAVEAGERLGFLPGDLAQKVDPYLRPLYDALFELMGSERVSRLLERGSIEIAPLAFMRGRTLNHAFIILDEAQNTTPEQMKMFLTRIGVGSKAVVTGDLTQIDLQRGQVSGLGEIERILTGVAGVSFIHFDKRDVVRHPLVARIVAAYEADQQRRRGLG